MTLDISSILPGSVTLYVCGQPVSIILPLPMQYSDPILQPTDTIHGGGNSNGGDGILGNVDDKGDSGDCGGNVGAGAGAATQLSTNALMDDGRGSELRHTYVPYGVQSGIGG
nr:hypothetical protein [Tanacetum cinerariifolium]